MIYHDSKQWLGAATVASSAENVASIPPLFVPMRGTWLDENIDLRSPEGDKITDAVIAVLDGIEKRDRKRRAIDLANHRRRVRNLLANGFRCLFHRQPEQVAYLRSAHAYDGRPDWLTGKALSREVDNLTACGLLSSSVGQLGSASTFKISKALFLLAGKCGVTSNSVTLTPPATRLVRVRSAGPGREFVDPAPSEDSKRWNSAVGAYNRFLETQDVALKLTSAEECEWVARVNAQARSAGMPLYRPEMFQKCLYRQFNNGTFENGGRLYGGWWITVPKAYRPRITINGGPTVELDYAGCAIRMLYQARGIDYLDDPYWIPEIAELTERLGLPADHYRGCIKALLQAAINHDEHGHPELIGLPLSFKTHFKRREVLGFIKAKHSTVSDCFGTKEGLRLQRIESDIALEIISTAMAEDVAVLPIHDSFVTTVDNQPFLLSLMREIYKKKMGFYPIIK